LSFCRFLFIQQAASSKKHKKKIQRDDDDNDDDAVPPRGIMDDSGKWGDSYDSSEHDDDGGTVKEFDVSFSGVGVKGERLSVHYWE
jgi:hypothetical protein